MVFPKMPDYLTTINLPYPMRLSWDIDVKVNKITCHKLVAENFTNVFNDILKEYGYEKIVELGIEYMVVVLISVKCEAVQITHVIVGV
jgi:hypothetical protein